MTFDPDKQCPCCYNKIMLTAKKAASEFVKKNSRQFVIDGFLWGSIAMLALIIFLTLFIGLFL